MLSETLYGKYIDERSGGKIVEEEYGFIAYRVIGSECFIMDMHVVPEKRKIGNSRRLMDRLASEAKELGCNHISGNVFVEDKGASNTLLAAINIGFKVASANNGVILIIREIEEDV